MAVVHYILLFLSFTVQRRYLLCACYKLYEFHLQLFFNNTIPTRQMEPTKPSILSFRPTYLYHSLFLKYFFSPKASRIIYCHSPLYTPRQHLPLNFIPSAISLAFWASKPQKHNPDSPPSLFTTRWQGTIETVFIVTPPTFRILDPIASAICP